MTLPKSGRSPSRPSPAFQFYPVDFLHDDKVALMTMEERGVYITLLCHAWTDGGIPSDVAAISRLVRVPPRSMARLWVAVGRCWRPSDDGRLISPRMERERALQAAYREQKVAAGKASADARKGEQRCPPVAGPLEREGNRGDTAGQPRSPQSTSTTTTTTNYRPGDKPPGRPSKPRKEPTGDHAEAVAHWHAEFLRTRGSPYAFGGKKDGEHVRALLASSSLSEFKLRSTALLESQEAFYAHADLGTLRSSYNKFAARRPPPRPSYDRPSEPELDRPRVDPAIARKAIKDALAASVGKPVP